MEITSKSYLSSLIWRKPAETFANYVKKGTLLGISGRLQTRNYENQQGQRVYVTEVVVESFYLLESRSQAEAREQKTATNQTPPMNNTMGSHSSAANDDPFGGNPIDISDDDLPF